MELGDVVQASRAKREDEPEAEADADDDTVLFEYHGKKVRVSSPMGW